MHAAPWIRISDADREAAVARLNVVTAEGRLTLEEFSDRTRLAYAARTWGELSRLFADLPQVPVAPGRPPVVYRPAAGQTDPLPLLALLFGVVSIPLSVACLPVGGLLGLTGIALAGIALSRAGRHGSGRGLALVGLLCGVLGLLLQVAMIVFFISFD